MSIFVVTGAAGFIGSNLVDALLDKNHEVLGIDNLSTGRMENISVANSNNNFKFHNIDLLDTESLNNFFSLNTNIDAVFHLAANADVRDGLNHPRKDLEQNTIATLNLLEAMRSSEIKKIVFSSTGSIYGEARIFPTPEEHPLPKQTSLYGASKLACESIIEAYCEGYGFQSWIFRFVGILGRRYSHGHVIDFYKKLMNENHSLEVLGDGNQKKSYLHVDDCTNAIILAFERANNSINIFNLGLDDYCDVNFSVETITKILQLDPKINYAGGNKGWIGDNPFIYLDTRRILSLGWRPKYNIKQSIEMTIKYLISKNT